MDSADDGDWRTVKRLIRKPGIDLNYVISSGELSGHPILYKCLLNKEWDIAREIINNPSVNLQYTPSHGPYTGVSILWLCAELCAWDLLGLILDRPGMIQNTTPQEGKYKGKSLALECAKSHMLPLVKMLLKDNSLDFNYSEPVSGMSILLICAPINNNGTLLKIYSKCPI